jgi:superfamily II DNA/RNA helicase
MVILDEADEMLDMTSATIFKNCRVHSQRPPIDLLLGLPNPESIMDGTFSSKV